MKITLRKIATIPNFSKHKRRFDRGGTYLNYIAILVSGGTFLKVFNITQWWAYALGTLLVILFRYITGYLDDRSKVLANEQDQYTKQNPMLTDMARDIKEIKDKL